jgi:hypothetical protein
LKEVMSEGESAGRLRLVEFEDVRIEILLISDYQRKHYGLVQRKLPKLWKFCGDWTNSSTLSPEGIHMIAEHILIPAGDEYDSRGQALAPPPVNGPT